MFKGFLILHYFTSSDDLHYSRNGDIRRISNIIILVVSTRPITTSPLSISEGGWQYVVFAKRFFHIIIDTTSRVKYIYQSTTFFQTTSRTEETMCVSLKSFRDTRVIVMYMTRCPTKTSELFYLYKSIVTYIETQ